MAKSIGIDLGTTNSVAGIKKAQLEIIKNSEGELLTPSCVTVKKKKSLLKLITNEEYIVGRNALEWIKQDPTNTITAVKRLMGRSLDDPEIKKMTAVGDRQYRIVQQSTGTTNSLAIILGGKEHTPAQISGKILAKLKSDAEKALADEVTFAVITVPAYFNDKQKYATRTAAALAGLKVQRLLPEPTAAAISFGVDDIGEEESKTVLVFDFGGGTFDLSVLTISGGQFIEQGKGGNMWLGGEDIDAKIMTFVLDQTAEEYDIENMEALIAGQDEKIRNLFLGELKSAAERAKIHLSDHHETYIEILAMLKDSDGDAIDIDVTLTRRQFEEMIASSVDTTITLTHKLLRDINFTPDLIDQVLLVGGSSRIPAVIKAIEKEFGQEKVLLHKQPMLAIAEGAAILSHRLSTTYECPRCGRSVLQSDATCGQCGFDLEAYIVSDGVFDIVHAAAHDYYIYLKNNERYLLIEKNTPLPCEKTERFKLVHAEQRLVHMKFFNIVNEAEESIGDLWLGIDEDEDKEDVDHKEPVHLEITLKIDENNLAEVTAGIKELPQVEMSKTLSRGKADEKLLLALEDLINRANLKENNTYVVDDLTNRSLAVIKDMDNIIDKQTDEVNQSLYQSTAMKIQKAEKMVEADFTSVALINYAQSALESFGPMIDNSQKTAIKRGIEKLRQMDDYGTYEENVKAYEALNSILDDVGWINILMTIQKAGEFCEKHEPAKAAKFFNAIDYIIDAYTQAKIDRIDSKFDEILPEAHAILDKYESQTDIIHKDISH